MVVLLSLIGACLGPGKMIQALKITNSPFSYKKGPGEILKYAITVYV
jgi:hypothetical protein